MNARRLRGPAIALAVALLPLLLHVIANPARVSLSSALAWGGAGLICASLLLMIREPGVAAAYGGLERMYRGHHAFGTLGYVLALAHPLALALPAAVGGNPLGAWQTLSPSTTVSLVGWIAAFGLMIGLGATFALHLPYALWRRLHATLGVSVLVAIAHVYSARGTGIALALLALPAAAGLAWRVLRSDLGKSARPYEVESISHPAQAMTEVTLRPLAAPILAQPGQFMMLAFFQGPRFHGCGEYHPFSVSGVGAQGRLVFTIKDLGDCTHNIQHLSAGVAARVQGPFGTFMAQPADAPELWIAGGIGIAAFIARIRADSVRHPTQLVYLHRTGHDAAYLAELTAYAADHPSFSLLARAAGDDANALADTLARCAVSEHTVAYVCGPPAMIAATRSLLTQRGMPAERVFSERFDFR